MDPFLWRTISYWAVFIGTALVLSGTIGTWYFGSQAETVAPFRQPIRAASATVELVIASAEDVNEMYMDKGGHFALGQGNDSILTTTATQCTARQLGGGRVLFRGVFSMDANDRAAGKPVRSLRDAEFAEISFLPMPAAAKVVQGTAVLTINSSVRLDFMIPEQTAEDGRVFVRDFGNALAELK